MKKSTVKMPEILAFIEQHELPLKTLCELAKLSYQYVLQVRHYYQDTTRKKRYFTPASNAAMIKAVAGYVAALNEGFNRIEKAGEEKPVLQEEKPIL